MLEFKKSFSTFHTVQPVLGRLPRGIAPVTRQAVLFRVYRGSQAELSPGVSSRFESSSSPFLSLVSLKVTFLCISFPVKPCPKKGLWRINGRRKIYNKSLSLVVTPSHSCPLYTLAFERTCRGVFCGRKGEDRKWLWWSAEFPLTVKPLFFY